VSEVGFEYIILAYMAEDEALRFLFWRLHRAHAIISAVVIVAIVALSVRP
jgi:hypothetical protein